MHCRSRTLLWLAAHGDDVAAVTGAVLPLAFLPFSSVGTAVLMPLLPLFLSLLGLALTKKGWATAATVVSSLAQTTVVVPALTQPMEQLVAQLARWLIYKLLLSLTKMLLAAAVRPKVGVTAHVCIQ